MKIILVWDGGDLIGVIPTDDPAKAAEIHHRLSSKLQGSYDKGDHEVQIEIVDPDRVEWVEGLIA